MEIMWTISAYLDNLNNIEYILNEWYLSVAISYEEKVIEIEQLLLENPRLGQFDNELSLYKILVVKEIYMLYEIKDDRINIIRMWNNYQRPYW